MCIWPYSRFIQAFFFRVSAKLVAPAPLVPHRTHCALVNTETGSVQQVCKAHKIQFDIACFSFMPVLVIVLPVSHDETYARCLVPDGWTVLMQHFTVAAHHNSLTNSAVRAPPTHHVHVPGGVWYAELGGIG